MFNAQQGIRVSCLVQTNLAALGEAKQTYAETEQLSPLTSQCYTCHLMMMNSQR